MSVPQRFTSGLLLAVRLRCSHCQRQRLPHEIAVGNERRGRLCWNCLDQHHRNLADLADGHPRTCNDCGVSFDELARRDENATMTVQLKDGILQLLCKPCARLYEPKAAQYKGTDHWWQNKFDGNK